MRPIEQPPGCRVLLVEDNEDVAEATAEFLRVTGQDVQIASSGQNALEIAGTFHPEIVLCDMWLPDMPGPDVLESLRSREGGKDILLVIFSAMSECDFRHLEPPVPPSLVDVFLSKPITRESLTMLHSRLHDLCRRT